jgi:hypothetical protein
MRCSEFTVAGRKKPVLIAVDTNVLLDQAIGDAHVLDALNTIKARVKQTELILTPTVLEELGVQAEKGATKAKREAAENALDRLLVWGYTPYPGIPVGRGFVEQTGPALRFKGLLPEEEENDSFIIAEAAHLNCHILLTSDSHMHDVDRRLLKSVLESRHAANPQLLIASPKEIVSKFFPRK